MVNCLVMILPEHGYGTEVAKPWRFVTQRLAGYGTEKSRTKARTEESREIHFLEISTKR